ncbi:hypothetical protein ACTI_84840 [Actinoplanes sp. OR16]|uniref:helix-turn-helix domain-containing protein n=1 Tax=Actinoplanes sp. OR16 TaxID=946334 RepID=UPI000F6EED94|nr:helix-turn-helix transcriptional regulator [Actinoplanes sp. OR16]BBH71799.1 hypothetical protein ACTI_84840 [Actinoplanes sp. OR16]
MEQPLPLIGRDREMRAITALSERGQATVLLVEGPPDSGRARLLRECAAAGRRRGLTVVEAADHVLLGHQPALLQDRGATGRPAAPGSTAATGLIVTTTPPPGAEVRRIRLAPLCPADVRRLVTAALGGARPGDRLLDLARVAAGRPGAVVRLIAGLRAEGLLRLSDATVVPVAGRLPECVRIRLGDRLATLSPPTRHLVQAAAALPSPFPPARLSALLGTGVVSLLPRIEEALESGLLVAAGDSLAFAHELVRGIVEDSMPRSVVAALHAERGQRPRPVPRRHAARPATTAMDWSVLSGREMEIAELVGQALTNRQIAARVGLSPHTVNYHLRQVFRKLGLSSRVELVSFLQRRAVKPVV